MKRKIKIEKIPRRRVEQIIAFCDDLGLVPLNLVTPRIVELVYNEWRMMHEDRVLSEEQKELSRLYLSRIGKRLNRRLRKWESEGKPGTGVPSGFEHFFKTILLDFGYPETNDFPAPSMGGKSNRRS